MANLSALVARHLISTFQTTPALLIAPPTATLAAPPVSFLVSQHTPSLASPAIPTTTLTLPLKAVNLAAKLSMDVQTALLPFLVVETTPKPQ